MNNGKFLNINHNKLSKEKRVFGTRFIDRIKKGKIKNEDWWRKTIATKALKKSQKSTHRANVFTTHLEDTEIIDAQLRNFQEGCELGLHIEQNPTKTHSILAT